ncbi:multiple epidermal growth factor-like domains protein 10 isoform X2 [Dreissena polymorpha]|uniref:multiple epidermal growth factor-like domains protein 10 isoform X2 n=1 Tax=Dreissena polymorpha TaxID=45954 RepID=UPI00226505AE|nr:multiple epidermal growth factor-like domains protein 10 isoform X2 [Dreissena polymorpha]
MKTYLIYFLLAVHIQDQCKSQPCQVGYYRNNNQICKRCFINCILCTDWNTCNSCYTGYHGTQCHLDCSTGCQGSICTKETGACTCLWGYTGDKCDSCQVGYYLFNDLCTECRDGCLSCTGYNTCNSCKPGYYKLYDSCDQCSPKCISCTNWYTCNACETGYYGTQCELSCSTGCKGGVCNKETGACTCSAAFTGSKCDSCLPGNYGDECRPCSYGCQDTCDRSSGTCSCKPTHSGPSCETCIEGRYGQYCTQTCRHNCKSCMEENTCLSCTQGFYGPVCGNVCPNNCLTCVSSDECLQCKSGYYGASCQISCGVGCLNGLCDKQSGACSPCMGGYRDTKCTYNCSEGCIDKLCRQNDAVCTLGCQPGYSSAYCCQPGMVGWSCEINCPTNCATCTSLTECQTCKEAFYGSQCNQNCPEMCKTCTSPSYCPACKNGYSGDSCQRRCPDKCLTCNNDGTCHACKDGFSRPDTNCQCLSTLCMSPECRSCANSSYYAEGSTCCPCNINCKHGTCKSAYHCTDGCEDGFFGPKCEFQCTQINKECSVCSGDSLESSFCKTCTNGYYPDTKRTCVQCSKLCVEDQCNSSNGHCKKGCKYGFWNPKCDRNCSEKCAVCNQDSGDCLTCSLTSVFGANCDMPCSKTCVDASCHMNGTCTNGCISDYYGPSCEQCPIHCARGANVTRCSHATGLCLFGCNEGFKGDGCMEALKLDNSKDTGPAIGGAVAAVVVVSIVVAVGLFIFVRRRTHRPKNETIPEASNNASNSSAPVYASVQRREHPVSEYENTSSVKANNTPVQVHNPVYTNSRLIPVSTRDGNSIITEDSLEIDAWDSIARNNAIKFEENGGVYYNNNEKVKALKIQVAELKTFVMSKNMDCFKKEFEKLPYGLLKEYQVSQMQANIGKNRYKGIYPYDDYRVKVRGGDTDYINASFIDGYTRRNEYIATLGPMSKQLGNFATFWRMVWQQNVEKIVMVTNLVEEGKDKCEKYWPSVGAPQMYDDIQVSCQSEDDYAEFTRRTFTVIKDRQTRTLTQLHFTSWPDKDVPEDVTSIIEFRQKVLRVPATLLGPTIVHCSAGIGRTGTYIAIDILTKEGEAEGSIDIPGCVLNMRQNRPYMVQTAGQYAYLHHAVVHSLIFECQPVASGKFQLYMDTTSKDNIRNIFHQLKETSSCESSDEIEAVARNAKRSDKNREGADVPGDAKRPKVYLNRKPGSTDYINAVFVNSFQKKNNYILAQTPLPNTVIDFVALLVQTNCACIVSLESANMNAGFKDIGVYLPADNQVLKNGIFSVRCSKTEANEYRNKRTLTVEHRANQANEALSLTYLEFTDWNTEERIPYSPANFRRFIAEVDAVTANSSDRPVMIHCLDGASKCGLFCVVATLLQKMEVEHEVSVANAVRKVKTRRKGAIPNLEQFQFCHDCVLDYTQSFNIYSNIAAKLSDC